MPVSATWDTNADTLTVTWSAPLEAGSTATGDLTLSTTGGGVNVGGGSWSNGATSIVFPMLGAEPVGGPVTLDYSVELIVGLNGVPVEHFTGFPVTVV